MGAGELAQMAEELQALVGQFKVGDEQTSASPIPQMERRTAASGPQPSPGEPKRENAGPAETYSAPELAMASAESVTNGQGQS